LIRIETPSPPKGIRGIGSTAQVYSLSIFAMHTNFLTANASKFHCHAHEPIFLLLIVRSESVLVQNDDGNVRCKASLCKIWKAFVDVASRSVSLRVSSSVFKSVMISTSRPNYTPSSLKNKHTAG
jgi:hypothetical protein